MEKLTWKKFSLVYFPIKAVCNCVHFHHCAKKSFCFQFVIETGALFQYNAAW